MRTLQLWTNTELSREALWRILADISQYPYHVTFVKDTILYGITRVGTNWDDITTILWVPLRMRHIITTMDQHRAFAFDLILPLGGTMRQEYVLHDVANETVLIVSVHFDLGNKLANVVVGPLLERRLRRMFSDTFTRLRHRIAWSNEL